MDTFTALALATDPPAPSTLNRKPSAPLITLTMWKMITVQSIYQLSVTLVLNFAGNQILGYTGAKQESLETLVFNTYVWMQFLKYKSRVSFSITLDHRLITCTVTVALTIASMFLKKPWEIGTFSGSISPRSSDNYSSLFSGVTLSLRPVLMVRNGQYPFLGAIRRRCSFNSR
jgi:magnesium-transporting ATPase (P-type)